MADATTTTCLNCDSFLPPPEAAAFFGKSIAAPMCAKFGHVLERPEATNVQNAATLRAYAEGCDAFGRPRPIRKPEDPNTTVFLPNPERRVELDAIDPKKSVVRGCGQCRNFITDETVLAEHGWAAGACQAKGRLITANRRVIEARNCAFRQVGPQDSAISLMLLPVYVGVTAAHDARLERAGDSVIEPLEYVSDKTVTPEDEELGIKAWRALTDSDGSGNTVYLPIFDPKAFTEEERARIPQTGDDEHPEGYFDHNNSLYLIAALWMELDETPAAWGMPGLGKTEIYRHLAWLMQMPFHLFSIKESTELYELEGSEKFSPEQGTYFRDGRFTKAWQSKCVMAVDEPNMGRPEVWAFLRPCLDNSKQLVLDSDGGRIARRNGFCFMGLAMNPAWSPLNVGTAPIGAADASRLMHIEFGYPEERVERIILKNRIKLDGWKIDDVRLNLVMAVSERLRELIGQDQLSMSWGIRENQKAARALRWFGPIEAYRLAAADYLEPPQREIVLDQVRAMMPSGRMPVIETVEEV